MNNAATAIAQDISEQQKLISEVQALLSRKLSIQVESPDADLFQQGALDSLAQVRLLVQLEGHFGLRLPMEDLEIDSFSSVRKIAELVATSIAARAGWARPVKDTNGVPGQVPLSAAEMLEQRNLVLEIRTLLSEKLSARIQSAETDLFQSGVFDSMTLVQFILQMEEHFGFHLPMEDIEPDSFRSVVKIAELIARRTQSPNTPNGCVAER